MSLIGDALRKTRQEAAERDGESKGVLFSAKIADGPTRSGLGLGLVLGALIAVFATVAGGAAVWWVVGGKRAQEQPPTVSKPVTTPASTTGDQEQPHHPRHSDADPDSDRGAGLAPPSTSPEVSAPNPPADTAATDADTDSVSASATDADSVPQPVPAPDAAPDTGFVGEEDGIDVYLMEADLGDVTLSLDFIVSRPTDPYAEINGVEIHIGGTVAGFRMKSVERDRVVLSDGRRTIVLRAP